MLSNTKKLIKLSLYNIFYRNKQNVTFTILVVHLPFKFEKKKNEIAHLAGERTIVLQYIRTQELVNFEK